MKIALSEPGHIAPRKEKRCTGLCCFDFIKLDNWFICEDCQGIFNYASHSDETLTRWVCKVCVNIDYWRKKRSGA